MKQYKKHVIIITDCKDVAFNEMKWIILRGCHNAGYDNVEVELVAVEEFSILNAAFLARLLAEQCLPGTILSLVINPLKTRSARIYGRLSNGVLFFGANTGALTWMLKDFDAQEIYEIDDPGFISFGGKHVHAPNIAKLLVGIPLEELGEKFPKESVATFDIKDGTIIHIDNFGLMKIKSSPLSFEEGQKFRIFKNGKYIIDATFAKRMMCLEDRDWVLYPGSSLKSFLELGSVRYKEGVKEIDAHIGDVLTWEPKS
jgi:S-adenosylmethionine hydrolase